MNVFRTALSLSAPKYVHTLYYGNGTYVITFDYEMIQLLIRILKKDISREKNVQKREATIFTVFQHTPYYMHIVRVVHKIFLYG